MKLLARLRYLLRRRQAERELAEEIEFHREMSGEHSSDPGVMGNITRAREDARAVWIWPWIESLWQDLTYALRNLRRAPGFTVVALLTLGTAIGLNTSFFTVFNAVALRPWPVKDPKHVVKIISYDRKRPDASAGGIGFAEYRYFAQHARTFAGFAVDWPEEVSFGFEPFGRPSHAELVAADHFQVLGVSMHLGRGFLPAEDLAESPAAVAVLSYDYWRDHFGSDPAIIGKDITLNDLRTTVVGVTPEDFTGTSDGGRPEDAYLPLAALALLHPGEPVFRQVETEAGWCCTPAMGRLLPGVSRTQAAAELEVLDKQFRAASGQASSRAFTLSGSALLADPNRRAAGGPVLALLFLAVTLVVLLACANVGNLLIARAGARQKEIEIRRAIGAGRGRIVRQLMTEGLLLALGAVAIGLAIAWRLPTFIITQTGEVLGLRLTPDATVLLYTILLGALTCVAFGLAPALHGTRLGGTGLSGTGEVARSRLPLRSVLLAVQVALSVVLLTGAGLALQGLASVRHRAPGFAIDGVSVVSFELPARDYSAASAGQFDAQLGSGLEGGPAFGITAREPLSTNRWLIDFRLPGQPENATRPVVWQEVTPGYFDVLRIPAASGRVFEAADPNDGVMLVNESLARAYFNGELPVGKTAIAGGRGRAIIGVVKDAYTEDLDRVEPTIYLPFRGTTIPKLLIGSASAQPAAALASRIEPRGRAQILPLEANVERWFDRARIGGEVAGMLGVFALILATVGMCGVFGYVVEQRTREIGIRMALGARQVQVVRLVLIGSSKAVMVGIGVGIALALLASRLMRNLLYGVSPLNPAAYLGVVALLTAAGIAASYAPARRAARVDPLAALRHD